MKRFFEFEKDSRDCLRELIHVTLADGIIDITKVQTIINRKCSSNGQLPVYINHHEIEALSKIIGSCITKAAIDCGFSFKPSEKLALISGAGIAGLATSFVLLKRGFKVLIAEKRGAFNRFNVINIDVESQRFLKEFGLLDEFEKSVASRIKRHEYVLFEKTGMQNLGSSDVSELQSSEVPFEPGFSNELFNQDGIYSVRIKDLQTFLAKKALEAGVHILGNVKTEVLACTQGGGVSKVQLTGESNLFQPQLKPYLLLLAEGAHSETAEKLGMKPHEVKNTCTGENWIFGNVKYSGNQTFVVSVIDTSGENLEIANIIFNAQIGEVNITVTSKRHLSKELIQERILEMAKRIFPFQNIDELPQSLISVVEHPVHIKNEKRTLYSRGNVFCIGDTAGHSSPLAGMGGTLGLTLVPRTIEQLVNDFKPQSTQTHSNFNKFTEAYVSRWMTKSESVKRYCLGFFEIKESFSSSDQEQTPNKELVLKN